ncbi:MAG: hypothetical protein PHQ28_03840 [Mycobacterium sp.]|nr:hypothetical protein [Mycobacterium sp.]
MDQAMDGTATVHMSGSRSPASNMFVGRVTDRQILRQCRRRGDAINHSLQIVVGPWNLKPSGRLPVNTLGW